MNKYGVRLIDPALQGYVPLYRRLDDYARGLSAEEAVALFHQMFVGGDLLAILHRDLDQIRGGTVFEKLLSPNPFFIPSPEAVKTAQLFENPGETSLLYLMGPRGAARWEAFTKADWSRYILDEGEYSPDGKRIHTLAGQRERVEFALDRFFPEETRVFGTEQWTTSTPWDATYWKRLPTGVVVTFEVLEKATVPPVPLWAELG